MLHLLSQLLRPQTGHIKKIYDAASGRRILGLKAIVDGLNLVGVALETFRPGPYGLVKLEPEKKIEDVCLYLLSSKQEVRKVITVFPNGDSLHNGWTVSVKPSRYPTLKKACIFALTFS